MRAGSHIRQSRFRQTFCRTRLEEHLLVSENPYEAPSESTSRDDGAFNAQWAGFGARLLAYLIDVVPITSAVAAVFYLFLGFDETFQQYSSARGDLDARIEFLAQRNQIRDVSFLAYIVYCGIA